MKINKLGQKQFPKFLVIFMIFALVALFVLYIIYQIQSTGGAETQGTASNIFDRIAP